ncbi:hypothetical protein WJX72_001312 [[Myrmecia] bisecta]|uniref:Fe2OG dioxygenase domain-containing protein n=1 Tax=[Myrmecia] bisecta TaxID=41462 RepID=A0AAW1QP81_9CHLO
MHSHSDFPALCEECENDGISDSTLVYDNSAKRRRKQQHDSLADGMEQLLWKAMPKDGPSDFCCAGRFRTTTSFSVHLGVPSGAKYDHLTNYGKHHSTSIDELPVQPELIQEILSGCKQSPFGRGTEAVAIKAQLAPFAPYITAERHKMVIYGPGSFFKAHVDTQRGQGHFASLTIHLPQPHKGGCFKVRHRSEELAFDFAQAKLQPHIYNWVAFCTDCKHEVEPITEGYRITILYNLHMPHFDASIPTSPSGMPGDAEARAELMQRLTALFGVHGKKTLVVVLAHQYAPKSLQVDKLKGEDAGLYCLLHELDHEEPLRATLMRKESDLRFMSAAGRRALAAKQAVISLMNVAIRELGEGTSDSGEFTRMMHPGNWPKRYSACGVELLPEHMRRTPHTLAWRYMDFHPGGMEQALVLRSDHVAGGQLVAQGITPSANEGCIIENSYLAAAMVLRGDLC